MDTDIDQSRLRSCFDDKRGNENTQGKLGGVQVLHRFRL